MAPIPTPGAKGGSMRMKEIKLLAKAIKLRLSFEQANDDVHDMLDAIVLICEEELIRPVTAVEVVGDTLVSHVIPTIQVAQRYTIADAVLHPGFEAQVVSYRQSERGPWIKAGIPKHQSYSEQVIWSANKGAVEISVQNRNTQEIFTFPIQQL